MAEIQSCTYVFHMDCFITENQLSIAAKKRKLLGFKRMNSMDIDLSTEQEIRLRFYQLCAYFAIQVRDKTEPQDVYLELYCIANALKEKYCPE